MRKLRTPPEAKPTAGLEPKAPEPAAPEPETQELAAQGPAAPEPETQDGAAHEPAAQEAETQELAAPAEGPVATPTEVPEPAAHTPAPVKATRRKAASVAKLQTASASAPGTEVPVEPRVPVRRQAAARKPAKAGVPAPPGKAHEPVLTGQSTAAEDGAAQPTRPALVMHPGGLPDVMRVELNGEVKDVLPTALVLDRPRWERLTEECSSALALMGTPAQVGVTSCVRGEGRSTIAVAMALAMGHRCQTTILLEADVEQPSLAKTLALQDGPGVAEVLRGEVQLGDCIQWVGSGLGVVTAGDLGAEPSWLAPRLLSRNLVAELGNLCDGLVVDLPPFLGSGVGVARSCPKVVLVVRAGVTPLDRVERVAAELGNPPAILNRAEETLPRWIGRILRLRR